MLNFHLNQDPPTAEEIVEEKNAAALALRRLTKRGWASIVSLVAIVILLAWLSPGDAGGVIIGLLACGGVFAHSLKYSVSAANPLLAGSIAGFFAYVYVDLGAAIFSGIVSTAGTWVIVDRLKLSSYLASLNDIAPSDCEKFVADCLADPLCEQYRQKVAALGRKPVVAEVKMIGLWVTGADAREKERREGIACALVASKEPLPLDSDTALKEEQSC